MEIAVVHFTAVCFLTANQDTPPDLMPDESTTWGARYNSLNSLAACPNSTSDFAMLAQCVSTPFTHKTPFNSNFFHDTGDDMRVCAHTHLHLRMICFYSFFFSFQRPVAAAVMLIMMHI